jgi:hypothetical protein
MWYKRFAKAGVRGGSGAQLTDQDNESWLIDAGDAVIRAKAARGIKSLGARDRLIYCLWVADYGMRNAGDLVTASDLHAKFQDDALRAASELRLHHATAAFSLPVQDLQTRYFDLFDSVCDELRSA